jgi:ankyrin repeat protein
MATLHEAAKAGDVALVAQLVASQPESIEAKDTENRNTPMHLAAKHGHADVVSALLTAGASYEATDADGSKPLLLAAHFGKTTCCEILMAAGADPNLFHPNRRYPDGLPLIEAAMFGHHEAVTSLLKGGAHVDHTVYSPMTALMKASSEGRDAVVQILIDAKANVNHKMPHNPGGFPLICAAEFGHTKVIEILLRAGAARDMVNAQKETALDFARRKKRHAAVALLEQDV